MMASQVAANSSQEATMSDPIDVFEASAFRQTSDGFIIRVPSFWLIGKSRHYLANETQKNEIVARVKRARRRSLPLALLLWLVVFAGFVTGQAFLRGNDQPAVRDVIVMIVFAIASLLLFLHFWYVLLLQPSLRLLAPTNERTTFAERRTALRTALRQKTPSGQFLMVGVLLSLSCCFSLYSFLLVSHGLRHSVFENGNGFASLFAAVVSGLAAALFFYREIKGSRFEGDAAKEKAAGLNDDSLDARFERLRLDHNQLRRNATIAAAFVAATAVGAIILNGTIRTVDADRLILRNGKGEISAMLAVGKDGAPTLGLYGPDHTANLLLGLSTSGAPSVGLYGPDHKVRAVFGLSSAGAPILRLNGPKEEGRLSFALADDGSPDLQLTGADGKSRLALTAHGSNPGLVLFDAAGAVKLKLAVDSTGVPIRIFNASAAPIKVFDANGKELPAPN
jgi:hypothetical protein